MLYYLPVVECIIWGGDLLAERILIYLRWYNCSLDVSYPRGFVVQISITCVLYNTAHMDWWYGDMVTFLERQQLQN
jgi:hypothetical protein